MCRRYDERPLSRGGALLKPGHGALGVRYHLQRPIAVASLRVLPDTPWPGRQRVPVEFGRLYRDVAEVRPRGGVPFLTAVQDGLHDGRPERGSPRGGRQRGGGWRHAGSPTAGAAASRRAAGIRIEVLGVCPMSCPAAG